MIAPAPKQSSAASFALLVPQMFGRMLTNQAVLHKQPYPAQHAKAVTTL
jgi:hypothetical protein